MGRRKQSTVRHVTVTQNHSHSDEVLGRRSYNGTFPSLDMMLAEEIAETSQLFMDDDDDEAEEIYQVNTPESDVHPRYRQNMPPTLAAIEQQIALRDKKERKRLGKASKRRASKSRAKKNATNVNEKHVGFVADGTPDILHPDFIMERGKNDSETTLLRILPGRVAAHSTDSGTALVYFGLEGTDLVFSDTGDSLPSSKACLIRSGESVRALWERYALPIGSQGDFFKDLIKCIHADWIQVKLCRTEDCKRASPRLALFLQNVAFDACKTLPMVQRRSQSKKFDTHNALQRVIKSLYGISKAAPLYPHDIGSSKEVTAKQVYEIVDNQQLNRYAKSQQKILTLDIPGLVPTLRPYQAAAVHWMLQRELSTICSEEWKVPWMYLNVEMRRTRFLIDEPSEHDLYNSKEYIFYCPFNGWIARRLEDAKRLTLKGRRNPLRGGCLAEQMGLGKSVELLACILAHPMPAPVELQRTLSCKRRLDFGESSSDTIRESTEGTAESSNVGFVSEIADFADDESSQSDGQDEMIDIESQEFPMSMRTSSTATLVTPDRQTAQIEERWVDEFDVGSCICGEIVSFPSLRRKQKDAIVLCVSCDEPMHIDCSCLEPSTIATSRKLVLRRTFGNESLECVLCETCPCCIVNSYNATIKSRATVIICPPAILDQWEREIKRHVRLENGDSLKVIVYDGVEQTSKRSRRQSGALQKLHPSYIADADIILMPFGALMSDLSHSDENRYIAQGDDADNCGGSSGLRKRKRYRVVPSPLLSIHFWRVAIDEAQLVEVTTTKAAKMALKLRADYFWAVSGTPIGHGKLQDLHGLFLLLGLAPFDDKLWFQSCLSSVIDNVDNRVRAILSNAFWRSTKASDVVATQLGIPAMIENRILLKFSSIERHFYSSQLSATLRLAGDCQDRFVSKRKSMKLDCLSQNIQRLRAACCHPQVGAHGVTYGRLSRSRQGDGNSVATRVLSMEQILDKFIFDSRQKCEEAQRLVIMHSNAMAAITKLKVEAKSRGIPVTEDDHSLLIKSGDMYRDSLKLADENAAPQAAVGSASLSGNVGFRFPNLGFEGGHCRLGWKLERDLDEVWARIDFHGTGKKITKLRIGINQSLPIELASENSCDFEWELKVPTAIILQVAVSSDGDFVDVVETPVNGNTEWVDVEKFRPTNRSKAWRVVVRFKTQHSKSVSFACRGFYVGLDMDLFEARIESDSLQILHCLHNASLSYEAALQLASEDSHEDEEYLQIKQLVERMRSEAREIESLYKTQPKLLHQSSKEKLKELSNKRKKKEKELFDHSRITKSNKVLEDGWDDGWYDDFLCVVCLYATETQQNAILERIRQDVDGMYVEESQLRFPDFNDLTGLRTALRLRLNKIRSDGLGKKQTTLPSTTAENEFVQIRGTRFKCASGEHSSCMDSILRLSPTPTLAEMEENSHCRLCKADWNQTGPICNHCKIGVVLQDLRPDSVTQAVLTALYAALRSPIGTMILETKQLSSILDRARLFFELLDAEEREKVGAWKLWRTHLGLLNDYDELSSTKICMRLSIEGEDLTLYAEDQLNAIVHPIDLYTKYHDHAAKQAMSLGDLRRSIGTLRFLENQRIGSCGGNNCTENCIVCLRSLSGECSVLKCGHRFHEKPCFEQILRNNPGSKVSCPMKCREATSKADVMIATDKSSHDGSRTTRTVKGSYGTKVTRLVSDILNMRDKGEKGVVFSQWFTMLEIVEAALWENGIITARPKGGKRFVDGLSEFQSPDCSILLLHLKQGAEGLTLIQATNVFMVEPVMNSGLDQQAINRIHRIGQTKRCFVWRYLMEDTVEMRIDQIRLKNQEQADALEDSILATLKKSEMVSAGGCDGGFASKAELLSLLG